MCLHVVPGGRGVGHGWQRGRAPAGQVAALGRVHARVRVLLHRLEGRQQIGFARFKGLVAAPSLAFCPNIKIPIL